MENKIKKTSLILILLLNLRSNLKAQETFNNKDNRLCTSIDMTVFGPQMSVAYDFYTKRGRCFGFSISQVRGLYQNNNDATIFYDLDDIRINLSFRHTYNMYESKIIDAFFIFKGGISYNNVLNNAGRMFLPSMHAGGGIDIKIIKSSGLRLEAGVGSPYFASAGYFFKF